MSKLSKGIKSVSGGAGSFLGIPSNPLSFLGGTLFGRPAGQIPGSENPFGIPNLDFLKNPIDLTKGYKPIDTTGTDAMFNDLLTNLGGQDQNDTEKLKLLLGDIGTDEANTVGSLKSDFLDRGLGGPGQISDIEGNALAQARSDADRTRAGARVATVGAGLDRTAKAYGDRYAGGLDTAKTNAATYNDLLKSGAALTTEQSTVLARLISDLFTGGANRQVEGYIPSEHSAIEDILRNTKLSFGKSV